MDWTTFISSAILIALTFPGNLCLGQNKPDSDVKSNESIELREAKVARESAERRVLGLELELESLRKEHDKLRSKYVELYLNSQKVTEDLLNLELRAANLLQSKDGEKNASLNSEALQALELVLSRQVELQDVFLDFQEYLNAMLEVIQPSQAVKDGLLKRNKRLADVIADSMKPLTVVAQRESQGLSANTAILKVDEELEIVILDKGTLSGVRPGKKWRLPGKEGKNEARLVTVDARPEISAAAVVEGNFKALQPGGVLLPDN